MNTFLNSFPAAIHETKIGSVWQMTFVSPYIETITGYPSETFLEGRNGAYSNLIHPDDFTDVLMTILASVERNVPYSVRYRLTHASGEVRWILERGARSLENGKIVGAIYDISEEVDLRETLEGIKTGLDATTMLAFADDRGIITWANEKFSDVSLYPSEEILGKHFSFLAAQASEFVDFGEVAESVGHGKMWKGDLRCRRKDTSLCWLETIIAPISEEGRIKRYFMLQQDVTVERRRIEIDGIISDLRANFIESGNHRTAFFDHLLKVILEVTEASSALLGDARESDGDGNLRILSASVGISASLVVDASAALRGVGVTGVGRLVVPVTYGGKIIAAFAVEGRPYSPRALGSEHDILLSAIAEMMNASFIEDELERQKSMSMQNARLASIGQLASGVGHEINNPLAIINGYLAIARDRLEDRGALDPELRDLFQKINGASSRIANIVRGLKTFAKSDGGQHRSFDLGEMMQETVSIMREMFQKDAIDFRLEVPAATWVIHGNRERMQQALVNLMSNARDAVRGRLLPYICVRLLPSGDWLRITVSDNGGGIPERIRNRIFDPFFTTKEVNYGTGIGLSLVDSILKEHGGSVDFETTDDLGTTFTLILPWIPSAFVGSIEDPSGGVEKTDEAILIIEAEADTREYLGLLVEPYFARVLMAATAGEALSLAKDLAPAVILSEINLPDMDGSDFHRRVLAQQKSPPRFIFLAGEESSETGAELLGHDRTIKVISKPFTNLELVEKLKRR